MSVDSKRLVLAGPMGAGKSTVGRTLAAYLGATFTDLDDLVVRREGRSIPDLFSDGEARFREAESEAARFWLGNPSPDGEPSVLALGGGTLQAPDIADALLTHTTVLHLDAAPKTLLSRLGDSEIAGRPLLTQAHDPERTLAELVSARADGYDRAQIRVNTEGLSTDEVAVTVLRHLYAPSSGPWAAPPTALAPDTDGGDAITVGRGCLSIPRAREAVLVWDTNLPAPHRRVVWPLLRALAAERLICVDRAGGEAAKSTESFAAGWEALLEAGVDRDTPVWVAGGGTLTDVGGFWAATFKRGLNLHLLPTTLLAQLDAALGGKNGINLRGVKNIVGTIRLPTSVSLDPLFLLTLDERDLRGGLSEAIKSGLIGDPELVKLISDETTRIASRALPVLESISARAATVKLQVVARDLLERGERRALNLGHTLGHALEAVSRPWPSPISHGEAVAIGMVFAARLARQVGALEALDLPESLAHLLDRLGLPNTLPTLTPDEHAHLRRALGHDKKRAHGESIWALPVRPGRVICTAVPQSSVNEALEAWR